MPGKFANIGADLAAFPLLGEVVGPRDALKEGAWPHSPSYLEIPEVIGEVKQPVLELDAGHIFTDIDGLSRELFSTHPVHSPLNAERFGIAPQQRGLIKYLRQAVNSARPTAVSA